VHDDCYLVVLAPFHAIGDLIIVDDVRDVPEGIGSGAVTVRYRIAAKFVGLDQELDLMALLEAAGDVAGAGLPVGTVAELLIQGLAFYEIHGTFAIPRCLITGSVVGY